ncbi:MAG: hypothetical protein NT051_05470 [Candidatus Micrarchaeota archaeon]|nr:hypothetical protein [Candidatus Micrarchaeota archaeon]
MPGDDVRYIDYKADPVFYTAPKEVSVLKVTGPLAAELNKLSADIAKLEKSLIASGITPEAIEAYKTAVTKVNNDAGNVCAENQRLGANALSFSGPLAQVQASKAQKIRSEAEYKSDKVQTDVNTYIKLVEEKQLKETTIMAASLSPTSKDGKDYRNSNNIEYVMLTPVSGQKGTAAGANTSIKPLLGESLTPAEIKKKYPNLVEQPQVPVTQNRKVTGTN